MLKLTTLLLDHNQLRDVPQALLDMKVVRISLDGNPLGSGMEHTIKYVRTPLVSCLEKTPHTGAAAIPLLCLSQERVTFF